MILMIQHFVDREEELNFLESKFKKDEANLIIIYGRRRVGKTELLKKFLENKQGVYFLCTRDSISENLKELKRKFAEFTGKEYFLKLEITSFYELFKYFAEEIGDKKVVIVLDEFPYLIELNRGIISQFQKIWDEILSKKKVMLILCGSSIGMMENEVLGYKSPLYGRRTGQWKVTPLKFRYLKSFFPGYDIESLIKVWGICGGIPYYLKQFDPEKDVYQNIKEKVLRKGEVLYSEPLILLREEFREPRTYMIILKYIALGYNTYGKLISVTGIERGNLSRYLATLEETHIIKHLLPLGQRKRGIYTISDQFFNFWFRFVYPNISDLEVGLVDVVFKKIKKNLNTYFGFVFENLILDLIKLKDIKIPIEFNAVEKWWHKDKEIDIIALNENTKEILFCECKWSDKVDAMKVIKDLYEKSRYVQWNNEDRREYFAIFAKSFKRRIEEYEGRRVYCWDLGSIEKLIKIHS